RHLAKRAVIIPANGHRARRPSDPAYFLPAYTRVDANLAYMFDAGFGPMRAQLNVLNLFDTFYYDSGGAFLPLYPGAPRTVTASLSYRFGGKR
ncbi:hypothetical protein V2I08_19340, partial [Sphingobium sp. MK2]